MLDVKRHRFEGIQFDESPHVGGKITPRFIVMHYTAGGSALSSVRAIRERGLSAHLFVDRDGGIIQTVPFNVAAFHAGPSSWRGFDGLNQHSIGIENANFGFFDRRTSDGWTRTGLRTFASHEVLVARHKNGGPEMAWELYPEAQLRALDAIVAAYSRMSGPKQGSGPFPSRIPRAPVSCFRTCLYPENRVPLSQDMR